VGKTAALYSGGTGFKSRCGRLLSWLRFLVDFRSSSGQIPALKLGHHCFVPQPFQLIIQSLSGRDRIVSIGTRYGLEGPRFEPQWGEIFGPVRSGPEAHPASCTIGTRSLSQGQGGRGVALTSHPLLAPRLTMGRAILLPPSCTCLACNGTTFSIILPIDAVGRDSVVGIERRCGLDGLGIEFWWGARLSAPVQTGCAAHPASCTMGTGSLSRV
jgi:hypothetical protein